MTLPSTHKNAGFHIPDDLLSQTYDELKKVANILLAGERREHTLQATALVHETYLRLAGQESVRGMERVQFLRIAARMARNVLVDHARKRQAVKRGGGWCRVAFQDFQEDAAADSGRVVDILDLDAALESFADSYERQAKVLEMRFFGGMKIADIAKVLHKSESTVLGDLKFAKAWLKRALSRGTGASSEPPATESEAAL